MLRISGELKPSTAEKYAFRFGGEQLTTQAEPGPVATPDRDAG